MAFRKGGVVARVGPYTPPVARPVAGLAAGKGGAKGDPDEGRMIYVSGLPVTAEWQELKDHMKQAGDVEFSQILMNEYGKSKGCGFVRYASAEEAEQAVAMLNGTTMDDGVHQLQVDMWTGKKPPTQKGSGVPGMGGGKGGVAPGKGFAIRPPLPAAGGGMVAGGMPPGGKGGAGSGVWIPMEMFQAMMTGKGMGKMAPKASANNGNFDKGAKLRVTNLAEGVMWQELKDHFKQAGTVEYVHCKDGMGEVRFSSAEQAQQAMEMLNGSELMGQTVVIEEWS